MNYLFDVSPEDVPDRKKPSTRMRARVDQPVSIQPKTPVFTRTTPLGRSFGHYSCADANCKSMEHEIWDDRRGLWAITCLWCGTGQRVYGRLGELFDQPEFAFPEGQFRGMTLAQVSSQTDGLAYIRWAAGKSERQDVRETCRAWLDANQDAQ